MMGFTSSSGAALGFRGRVYSQGLHPSWGHQGLALLDMGEAEATPIALPPTAKTWPHKPSRGAAIRDHLDRSGTSQGQAGRAGMSAWLQQGGCEI